MLEERLRFVKVIGKSNLSDEEKSDALNLYMGAYNEHKKLFGSFKFEVDYAEKMKKRYAYMRETVINKYPSISLK